MTVWVFRKTVKSKEKLGEFEYIGFSAFWGIILIALYNSVRAHFPSSPTADLFSNPFAAGLCLSIAGMIGAWVSGLVWNFLKKVI